MKIVLLNGSPKKKDSASGAILDSLCRRLETDNDCVSFSVIPKEEIFMEKMKGCQAFVIIFPLYVDGIPSHLLRFLERVSKQIKSLAPNVTVYAIVNNGFYEGKQNHVAIEMVRNFALASEIRWGQGLGAGAGGMVNAAMIGYGPMKNLGVALDTFSQNIMDSQSGESLYVEPNFPRFLYKAAAHYGWRKQAKSNGLNIKNLYQKR